MFVFVPPREWHAGDVNSVDYSFAEHLAYLVQRNPLAALEQARVWVADHRDDARVESSGWSAIGRALLDVGRIDAAKDAARRALSASDRVGDRALTLAVVMSGVAILADGGSVDEALVALDRVSVGLTDSEMGRVEVQRAYVLHHAGLLIEALGCLDRAERLFDVNANAQDRIKLRQNRGLVLLQLGRLDAAETDFRTSGQDAVALGLTAANALSAANLGVLFGRARRIAESMRQFAIAASLYAEAGEPSRMIAILEIDRSEVLMHAGLAAESVKSARRALVLAERTGNQVVIGDGQMLIARTELAAGNFSAASRAADVAADSYRQSGRERMVAHARSVGVHAALHNAVQPESGRGALLRAAQLIENLLSTGWEQLADDLRVARVRAGHRLKLLDEIAADLAYLRLGAFSGQRDAALAGWYVEALCRALADDSIGALDACRSGLDLLDAIVAEAPTLERRSAAMRLGEDLSQLAIDLAVEHRNAEIVFAAAEGTRARALHDELVEAERHKPLSAEAADQLRRELSVRLGNRVLVEWVLSGSRTWAVVVDQSGSRLVDVGDTRAILRARDRVLVWLDRASAEPDGSSRNAIHGVALLDDLVISPLNLPSDSEVVLVPVGGLHGIPWSGLPSLAHRSVTLAPNAQLWLESDRRAGGSGRTVGLIVGPGVESANIERGAVERNHPGATIASGAGATAQSVCSMFAGLDLVHVAAHGVFRSDHPLMSTIMLHDGEMTLYDTVPDRVRSRLIVLSSCEGGAQGTADGSEVLGLASVMLARGAAAVLAPLTVVRDLECADFVAEVHGELAAGVPFGQAVSAVRQRWLAHDDLSRWAVASSFTCFGSGAVTIARE